MPEKIAVIGDKDSVLAFKALGVDVFGARSAAEASDTLKKLAREYAVIFITEDIAQSISDIVERYRVRAYPAVIPIPSSKGTTGYGMSGISKDVERAIGADILFNNKK
ncbi:MAG: V-type ATP synthase subunit F [Clostridiales bacterium]|jgi:V/A-type H+-transporting ATPase subunit F|nr:V-type ATP synthase subunit F [Clostridiales bacterium]HOB64633.1 V-type ATP synthase subunit F [Clostridia bacterium]HOK81366.1 V-type ATP synthase subunit F [Clostridia bacterium]HOL60665.1 V-type ATP synthase subunit F [Clostridia bacterium]HPO53242.1 V-type ATP synthase subunit F [Clostridia bacterium]